MKKTEKQQKIENKLNSSNNIKSGKLTATELSLYNLPQVQIQIILDFQEKLPVLQQDDESWVNARDLWEQLGVGKMYSHWIAQQIEDMDFEESIDYNFELPSKANQVKSHGGDRRSVNCYLTVAAAKEVAMVAGAKGGRTSTKLKEMSRLTRKYFLAVEKAFQNRESWNYDRAATLVEHEGWRKTLGQNTNKLRRTMPDWADGNIYAGESNLINKITIGSSKRDYLKNNNFPSNAVLRNILPEQKLEDMARIQEFDADLISVMGIYDMETREKFLSIKMKNLEENRKVI